MNRVVIVVLIAVVAIGLIQVLAEEQHADSVNHSLQQEVAVVEEQPTPSPLNQFERSLLAWAQLHSQAVTVNEHPTPSPLTRLEHSLLAWGSVQSRAATVETPAH